jgi:hypothetical protein
MFQGGVEAKSPAVAPIGTASAEVQEQVWGGAAIRKENCAAGVPVRPLGNAHAHNDYAHSRPLQDALAHGFQHIEVDIHLIGEELYVAHDLPAVPDPARTLARLYLEPLQEILQQQGMDEYPCQDNPLNLVIDIKSDADRTYERLKEYLSPYLSWITAYEGDAVRRRAVNILLSGNRPVERLLGDENRLMALDGRVDDLGKGIPRGSIPLVSENFRNIFGEKESGWQQPNGQWLVFRKLVRLAAGEGKIIRLWGSPEEEACWTKLLRNGAGIINVDDLGRLRRFMLLYQWGRPHLSRDGRPLAAG